MAADHLNPVTLLLLRIAAGAGAAIDGDMARLEGPGWRKLAQQAIDFRLGPWLVQAIADHRWPAPHDCMVLLERDRREQALRALSQRRTLAHLARRMNALGMPHAALKGGALIMEPHADRPALRIMRDIDILLAPADASRLHADLLASGWSVPPGYLRDADPDSHHLAVIADPENGNLIELHVRLTKTAWPGEPGLRDRILHSAITASCLGVRVGVADPFSNFLHLLAHATLNRPFDPGPQFLADISGLIDHPAIDPDALAVEAQALGLGRALGLALGLIDHLAGLPDDRWRRLVTPGSDAQLEPAMHALLNPQGRDRELRFRGDIARSRSAASWLMASLGRAFSPRAEALAAIAGREPDDPLRYLAYPRWIAQRISSMARATFDSGIRRDTIRAAALKDWLSSSPEGGADEQV
ncbi:MAG: nucleotidyltransferase family protein [Novosphingobium sp.]